MLCKLAFGNLRRNFHRYWAYFLSSAFSVFVLYLFLSVVYGENAGGAVMYQSTGVAFAIGAVLDGLFAAFFIWYSNSFFIKSRKKEFATYMLLGMSKGQTVRLSILESFTILALAYAAGIASGILLDKFMMMLLFSIMQIRASVPFEVNLQALKVCAYVYAGVVALVLLDGAILLNKNSLLELINAGRKSEKGMRASAKTFVVGLLAVAFLGLGYYFAVARGGDILLWPVIVTFVVIGTVLLFTGLATLFFHFGRKNEASLYRGTRLVTLSQLMHRYRGNVGALSMIAVTTSVALCAVLCCCSIFGKTEESTRSVHPFSVQFMSSPERQRVFDEALKEHPEVSIRSKSDIRLLYASVTDKQENDEYATYLISQTNYNGVLEAQGRKDLVFLTGYRNCLYVQFMQNYSGKAEVESMLGREIAVSAGGGTLRLTIAQTCSKTYISLSSYMRTVVVPDGVYDALLAGQGASEFALTGYMFQDDIAAGPFVTDLMARMKPLDDRDLAEYRAAGTIAGVKARFSRMDAYYPNYMEGIKGMGVLLFVGVFIGLLFIVATGGILYFRMAMEASEDREKFALMRKIGMSAGEIRQAVAKELAVVFGLPFAMAALNAFFASYPLEGLVGLGTKDVLAAVLAVYAVLYGLYYLLTLRKYTRTLEMDT